LFIIILINRLKIIYSKTLAFVLRFKYKSVWESSIAQFYPPPKSTTQRQESNLAHLITEVIKEEFFFGSSLEKCR